MNFLRVYLSQDDLVHVVPDLSAGDDFEHIDRAANGTRWDSVNRSLHHAGGSGATVVGCLRWIFDAVRDEYGIELRCTASTVWDGMSPVTLDFHKPDA